MKLLAGVTGDAVCSPDGVYRYDLTRSWDASRDVAVWVMLNPSTADATMDDQTLRQVQHYTRAEGLGSLHVVNLFALRSTDPAVLARPSSVDPVGPVNDVVIEAVLGGPRVKLVVCAWGAHGARYARRVDQVVDRLVFGSPAPYVVRCLGLTDKGQPRHPCRLGHGARLIPYRG